MGQYLHESKPRNRLPASGFDVLWGEKAKKVSSSVSSFFLISYLFSGLCTASSQRVRFNHYRQTDGARRGQLYIDQLLRHPAVPVAESSRGTT